MSQRALTQPLHHNAEVLVDPDEQAFWIRL